jgi:hypothetical protein
LSPPIIVRQPIVAVYEFQQQQQQGSFSTSFLFQKTQSMESAAAELARARLVQSPPTSTPSLRVSSPFRFVEGDDQGNFASTNPFNTHYHGDWPISHEMRRRGSEDGRQDIGNVSSQPRFIKD